MREKKYVNKLVPEHVGNWAFSNDLELLLTNSLPIIINLLVLWWKFSHVVREVGFLNATLFFFPVILEGGYSYDESNLSCLPNGYFFAWNLRRQIRDGIIFHRACRLSRTHWRGHGFPISFLDREEIAGGGVVKYSPEGCTIGHLLHLLIRFCGTSPGA